MQNCIQQEAHWPWLAHLSEIATADMQMLCNIFHILLLQLMKGSSFEQFLVLKKKNVFFIIMTIWTNSQSCFNSRVDMKFSGNWPSGFWREVV